MAMSRRFPVQAESVGRKNIAECLSTGIRGKDTRAPERGERTSAAEPLSPRSGALPSALSQCSRTGLLSSALRAHNSHAVCGLPQDDVWASRSQLTGVFDFGWPGEAMPVWVVPFAFLRKVM